MEPTFYCEICHAPMVLVKKLSTVKRKNTMYRRRRYKCTVCDFQEMICGDGSRDKQLRPGLIKSMDLADLIKQEENRNEE